MKKVLVTVTLVGVVLLCTTAYASPEFFKVRVSEWNAIFNMNLAVSKNYSSATELSTGDLGLDRSANIPALELILGKFFLKFTFGYWDTMYKGSGILDIPVDFKGIPFSVGTPVASKFGITSYDLRAQFNVLPVGPLELGLVGGIRVSNYYVQIVNETLPLAVSDSAFAGAPYIGVAAEVPVSSLVVGASFVSFRYNKAEFKLSKYVDTSFYLEFRPIPFLALRSGFNNIQIGFEKTGKNAFNLEQYIKGPFFGVFLAF